jgi:hypothetical protein
LSGFSKPKPVGSWLKPTRPEGRPAPSVRPSAREPFLSGSICSPRRSNELVLCWCDSF